MSYVIKARLSNAKHPENGVATVPFPLSGDEYAHSITEVLEPMEIGSAVSQDCKVEEIDSSYEVLQCLKGQEVNVDELDYLAKRLDSFDEYEAKQFQAVCSALGCRDIMDLINLTCCCQESTVISDFSKLEEAGKQHYLNIHGGAAPVNELEKVDGKALAQSLIQSGEGKPTPYGLLFLNQMQIENQYSGQDFPPFPWNPAQGEVEIEEPCGWTSYIFLPTTRLEMERFLQRGEISDLAQCKLKLYLYFGALDTIDLSGDPESIWQWSDLCREVNALSPQEERALCAAIEITDAEDVYQIQTLMSSLRDFDLVPGVHDAESYGKYMIQKSGKYVYDEALDCYYNYEAFGEFLMAHEVGQMTKQGYLKCEEGSAFLDFFTQTFPEGATGGIKNQGEIPVTITPMGQPEKQECLVLPCPADHIARALQQLGVASLQACSISVDTDRICPAVLSVFEGEFDIAEHFETFNLLARCYQGFDDDTIDRFHVVFDGVQPQTPEEVLYLAQSIAEFVVVPDISTEEEYGYYLAQKSGSLVPNLLGHYNYQEFGATRIQAEHGLFGDKGYVAYMGTDPQITAMLARFAPPQHKPVAEMGEKSMTMGGM